jgi:hypothetical protein
MEWAPHPWDAGLRIVNRVISADARNDGGVRLAHQGEARRCNARA